MAHTPETIRAAGRLFIAQLASPEDSEPERDLLLALGSISVRSLGHRRAVLLCCLAVDHVLNRRGWPTAGPVEDARRCLALIHGCLKGAPNSPMLEWAQCCHADDWCRGKPCQEGNEEYNFGFFGMVAALCRFTMYAGIWDGVEVLQAAPFLSAPYRELEFDTWLVNIALPAAYEMRELG